MAKQQKVRWGLIMLILKLGAKIGGKALPVFLKLLKGTKTVKVGLAATSFGASGALEIFRN